MTRGIALLVPSLAMGGAERVVLNLAAGLAARGERVHLIVLDGRGPLRDQVAQGIEVIDLRRRRARTALPALVRTLRRIRPEAVLSSATHLNVLLAALRPFLIPPVRIVVREPTIPHPDDDTAAARVVLGRALRRVDATIASSPAMRERLERIAGARARIHEVPNPVDVTGLRSRATEAIVPRDPTTDVAGPTPVAIVVGRLVDGKGHADLLDALAATTGGMLLDVVGDGPLQDALERRASEPRLAGRVRFHGRVDDRGELAGLIAAADVLVQPARFEGMPNTVLEALALGTPVLATTDLGMLDALSREVGAEALRLVPRGVLADALAATERRDGPRPGPSLLPERFRTEAVAGAVLALLRPTATA